MKRMYIIMMLLLVGIMVEAQTSVWDGSRKLWTRGSGTEADPYLIETAAQLAFLSYMVNKDYDTQGLYFRLTTDIDLNGSEDQPW
ncbi:MAG: peptidase A26, partial [Bacteroidales bacterium]|nr:peptidase A26 [Bacteroidales bacterium]